MIIAALNAEEHIEQQLLAFARQRTEVRWELIVADNGSTDGTVAIVERVASQTSVPIRALDASARRGVSAARNAGAAVASGALLLFADADDVVHELWVDEMVGALRLHPFVGGRQELSELNGETVRSWREPIGDAGLPIFCGVPYVMGGNFGCTAAAFAAVGGFDERFLGGGEDVDISMRMHSLGMTAVFAERAIVHYRYRRDPLQTLRQMWGYGRTTHAVYGLHGIDPPTFLDVVLTCHRSAKQAVRARLRGQRPVREVGSIAYAIGEASILCRDPAFWRPVTSRGRVANPILVQRDRLHRLAGLIRQRG